MMRYLLGAALFLGMAHLPLSAQAQGRKEPLADQVKKSIDRGVAYLRSNPNWESNIKFTVPYPGGSTALALLALLNCGVSADDPLVKEKLHYLRGLKEDPPQTYVKALQTMVFVEVGQAEDWQRIKDNVKWLIDTRIMDNKVLKGWGYPHEGSTWTDNSNSQYALLGLWAGRQAGVPIDRVLWEQIKEFYERTQERDGSWNYSKRFPGQPGTLPMTTAGVCGLVIASMELNPGREKINPDGTATNCGVYDEIPAIQKGLGWISNPRVDRLDFDLPPGAFYNMYGIERVGRLSGLRFLGAHDWYREGCKHLIKIQRGDGSWSGPRAYDQSPAISTSFALLFLSKGRTPVLISKLVHTARFPRPEDDTDWNNDRNDLRHLVDYASKSMFKNFPLAWQNFDMMQAAVPGNGVNLTEEDLLEVTSDLLQSPILYFNGHKSPRTRFLAVEKELLKKYVDNGGFLLVEACCGSREFDQGFKTLAQELWPDNPLEDLDPKHPVWSSHGLVTPGDPYKLMGISMGCKTVLIYSPQDLSCQWEANNPKTALGDRAFKLGGNIIAYATGMEPPRPRLTNVELASTKEDPRQIPRGFFKVAQLKHGGDWQPAPRAMRNLMDHLRKEAGLDVALKTEELQVASKSVIDFKFLYMHGRSEFSFTSKQVEHLRFNLENGGLLFADACCGKPGFDRSFRQFAKVLFPDHKLEEVPLDDPLYSKELNGTRLDETSIMCRREPGGEMRTATPFLEGIRIDGRWVVLYSKYDIGCALERHKSSDCLGYDEKSAQKIAGAAVLYLLNLQL
jgi:hypothetical protein